MADDSRDTDQQKIDSAISELAERKNDVGSEKPSTSTPQKRPSPNSNDHQLTSKRVHTLPYRSFDATNESVIEKEENDANDADSHLPADEKTNEDNSASCSQIEQEIANNYRIAEPFHSNNSNSIRKPTLNVETMCINPNLTNKSFMKDFHTNWLQSDTVNSKSVDNCKRFNNDSVKLYNKPFKICIVSEYLENRNFTQQMVDEMCQMEWHRKQMDLYEFHQTTDLANLPPNAKPALKRFYNIMGELIFYIYKDEMFLR